MDISIMIIGSIIVAIIVLVILLIRDKINGNKTHIYQLEKEVQQLRKQKSKINRRASTK